LAKTPQAQVAVSPGLALVIGVADIALPASDRQHELDAGQVGHLRQSDAVGPAPDQRSGAVVTARPEEQMAPKRIQLERSALPVAAR
jgi:hypothetical protein